MFFLILFLLPTFTFVDSQLTYTNCSTPHDTYIPYDKFHQNLQAMINNLNSAASKRNLSFHTSNSGTSNIRAYGLYLCRGDLTPKKCSSCVENITKSITNECRHIKEAIKWIPECMVRYANHNIISKEEEYPFYSWMIGYQNIFNDSKPINHMPFEASELPFHFNKSDVIHGLINATAFGHSPSAKMMTRYYATREDKLDSWRPQTFYSLAQCTPDLSPGLCFQCLRRAFDKLSCCRENLQAVVYLPSCQLRYDTARFFEIPSSDSQDRHPTKHHLSK